MTTQFHPKVDLYLSQGCGRCSLFATPDCKVHRWNQELKCLREIVLDCGLKEEVKWSVPCYTLDGKNIIIIAAFKEYCSLNFIQGVLLSDPKALLEAPGENSQSARMIRFEDIKKIRQYEKEIRRLIGESIERSTRGEKVAMTAKDELEFPIELQEKFKELPAFRDAFLRLTPGRQRGYILYFNDAKQTKTRMGRIEKYIPLIMEGRGIHDR